MSLAATGIFGLPVYYAMQTLAASTTWQGALGAANSNGALAHIFQGETDEHASGDMRPRALMDVAQGNNFDKVSDTGFLGRGPVEMVLEVPTPPAYQGDANRRDARVWFYNLLGGILADMQALAGTAGYLNIIGFEEQTTGRADPKENNGDDFWVSVWHLNWLG